MSRFWVTVHETRSFDIAVEAKNKLGARVKAVAIVRGGKTPAPDYVRVDPIYAAEVKISDAELKCFQPKEGVDYVTIGGALDRLSKQKEE